MQSIALRSIAQIIDPLAEGMTGTTVDEKMTLADGAIRETTTIDAVPTRESTRDVQNLATTIAERQMPAGPADRPAR